MRLPLPPGARDCHVHVFGFRARFPLARDGAYTPREASIERLRGWGSDAALFHRILVDNPTRLYDFPP